MGGYSVNLDVAMNDQPINEISIGDTSKRPLVTFALFAYNQEKYIREAVEGVFSQKYSPLEIILSDDCSSDRTFEIMKEMVGSYIGKHKIILNRNKKNFGISLHVRHVHEMAEGEIIVHAAGDDISNPDRTQKIVDAFLAEDDKPSLIESNAELIDENGTYIDLYHQENEILRKISYDPVLKLTLGGGCTYAVHRTLIDKFDAPMSGIFAEDGLINTRANMLNGALYIPDVLVKYRISSTGVWSSMMDARLSSKAIVENEAKYTRSRILIAQQAISDAKKLHKIGIASEKDTANNICYLSRSLDELKRWLILCDGSFMSSTLAMMFSIFKREYIPLMRWLKIYSIRWIPFSRQLKAMLRA